MIKVTITDSSGRERELEITSEPKVCGRGEDSDLVLGSRSVSRHHLRIWEEKGKVMVEDLTGGTGITIDGEEVSGTFELEPGADLEAGIFIFNIPGARLDTSLDGETFGEEIPIPMLHGTKGPTKGLEIELQDGDNDIGRDPALYLVIDDPSVSRQHARLTVEAGRFTVVDMRSSNGTFVNNRRIESQDIKSGDIVRFGNLEFEFRYGKAVSKDAARMKRKKKLIVIGSVIGGLILIAILIKVLTPPPPPKPTGPQGPTGPSVEVLVEQHLRTARNFMTEGEWKAAIKELDKALDLHPICRECRKLKTDVEDEIVNKGVYDQCVVDYDLNSWTKALNCFRKLPEGSFYEKKSKYKVSECISRLKTYHMGEGRGYFNARRYKEAHKHFSAYMELDPCDQKVFNKWLKKTEKRLRANYIKKGWTPYEWACQTQKSDFGVGQDPEEILKGKYPDKKFYEAIMLYYQGKVDPSINKLQRIVALSNDKSKAERAREMIRDMRVVKGKYYDGLSRMNRGRLKEARDQFDQSMDADRRLMPTGVTSFFREDIGKQLADKLYKEGLGHFSKDRYREAFALWKECLERNPAAKDCQNGMIKLDGVGETALKMAERLASQKRDKRVMEVLKEILEITTEESMSNKKARIWINKIESK